jgi:hypothetical protein
MILALLSPNARTDAKMQQDIILLRLEPSNGVTSFEWVLVGFVCCKSLPLQDEDGNDDVVKVGPSGWQ